MPYSSHSCVESNEEHRCSVHCFDRGEESPSRSQECAVHLKCDEYSVCTCENLLTLGTTQIQCLKVTLVLDSPLCMARESRWHVESGHLDNGQLLVSPSQTGWVQELLSMRNERVVGENRENQCSSHIYVQLYNIQKMTGKIQDKRTFWDCQKSDKNHTIFVRPSGTVADIPDWHV